MNFNETYNRLKKIIQNMENEQAKTEAQKVFNRLSSNAADYMLCCNNLPGFEVSANLHEDEIQKALQNAVEQKLLAEHGPFETDREFIDTLQTNVKEAMYACYFASIEQGVVINEDGYGFNCEYQTNKNNVKFVFCSTPSFMGKTGYSLETETYPKYDLNYTRCTTTVKKQYINGICTFIQETTKIQDFETDDSAVLSESVFSKDGKNIEYKKTKTQQNIVKNITTKFGVKSTNEELSLQSFKQKSNIKDMEF